MKCTVLKSALAGGLTGLMIWGLSMVIGVPKPLYYLSGIVLSDSYMSGRGESAIGIGLLLGLLLSVILFMTYFIVLCKLYSRYSH